jgi:pimeloyl-ACP methyl ester carboxylesterase
VIVVPGFRTGDRATAPLRAYLRRLGYDARGWGLGINHGHPESDRDRLAAIVQDVATEHGPVGLVGWSLGGVIVREVARELPHHVDGVVLFGSPIIGGPTHTIAARASDPAEVLGRASASSTSNLLRSRYAAEELLPESTC